MKKEIKTILKGMGQIMLQNSWITGGLFLLGIFINSWIMGIGAVLGVVSGTLAGKFLKYDSVEINNGLYGFNGALVGIALTFFFKFSVLLVVFIILFSILSSYIMHLMLRKGWKPFTFPFVFSTWIALIIISYFSPFNKISDLGIYTSKLDIFSATTMGFGQVMFQGSIIAGIIFFIGILLHSKKSALYGLLGSILGMLIAMGLEMPINLTTIGLFGYNAVLCAIAFADDDKWSFVSVFVSVALSVIILDGLMAFGVIALTAPFVFSTWIALFLRNKFGPR